MKLGLIGGTFNPIHNGHLKIARRVLNDFDLAKVIFIPSGSPPHKNTEEIADSFHRLRMLELAIAGEERFEVSDVEIKRKGKSYTLDTIRQMKAIYGEDATLYFIAGTDMALDFPKWKDPLGILELSHFIAVERPRFPLENLAEQYRKKIISVKGISVDISSSDIRRRIKEGKSVKSLVSGKVEEYIKKNGLYI